jgi:hypothetical protein
MKRTLLLLVVGLVGLPLVASAETWKGVSVIDTNCVSKVKADPDKHTAKCALSRQKGGYGLLTADGTYLSSRAGNAKSPRRSRPRRRQGPRG